MIKCTVGIMAHNEAQNIERLILALEKQNLEKAEISEIIIVSSGSTDGTNDISKKLARNNPKIRLLIQEKRKGKSCAINLFLKNAKDDLLVLESADTIPQESSIEKLIRPFEDEKIGMTGGHPIPINNENAFMRFVNSFMWELHHILSLRNPKMGEMIAFRKIFEAIPENSSVDEASIENIVSSKGYAVKYIPEAIVNNKGPETIGDFLKQRRRIYSGHLSLKRDGYKVSTMESGKIFQAISKSDLFKFKNFPKIISAIILEIFGRFLGWYDFKIKRKDHSIWEIAKSTKKLN